MIIDKWVDILSDDLPTLSVSLTRRTVPSQKHLLIFLSAQSVLNSNRPGLPQHITVCYN